MIAALRASVVHQARNRQPDMLGRHDIVGHAILGPVAAAIEVLQRRDQRDGEKVQRGSRQGAAVAPTDALTETISRPEALFHSAARLPEAAT
jgi:hypothetical protein